MKIGEGPMEKIISTLLWRKIKMKMKMKMKLKTKVKMKVKIKLKINVKRIKMIAN